MVRPYYPLSHSLWAATASAAPETHVLQASLRADVAIVGAGFCGLSTALHLAEAGARVVVLDAQEIGFGGSGRNGGQVIPGIKYDPSEIVAKFGAEQGQKVIDFVGGTADTVFDLIEKHAMDVPHVRRGWIQGAHTAAALQLAERRVRDWRAQGVAARMLDKAAVSALLGTDAYLGGWLDPRGGGIQPLSFAYGLAKAAQQRGVSIHTGSAVTSLAPERGGWTLKTAAGAEVHAEQVVLATNGYTDGLWPHLQKTIIDANSFQIATEPLPPAIRSTILPEGQVSSDARNLLLYFRLDHAGRLLMGGRGTFAEPDPRAPRSWAHLDNVVRKLFPQTEGVAIAHRWCGHVAITQDFLPHIHTPAPGLTIDIGCQGRGVGLQTRMGQALAESIRTRNPAVLPFAPTPIRPFPFHALRRVYLAAAVAWYRLTDGGVR